MARTTKTPHKVSRNKSGTPIVRASKFFPGRPKRTTRETAFETEQQAKIFAEALNLAAVRDGDWRWLKGEEWTSQRRYVDEVLRNAQEQAPDPGFGSSTESEDSVRVAHLSSGRVAPVGCISMTEAARTFMEIYTGRPGVEAGKNYRSWLGAVAMAFEDLSLAEVADLTPESCGARLWRMIDPKDTTRWHDEGFVGGRTVNSRLNSLEALLRYSIDNDWLIGQPRFFSASPWTAPHDDLPIRWWDMEQLEAVHRELQLPRDDEEVVAFLMAEALMFSGLRWGEVAAQQWIAGQNGPYHWKAVDPSRSMLTIRVSWKRRGETLGPTKTGNTWSAICTQKLSDTLRKLKLVTGKGGTFLFPRPDDPSAVIRYERWRELFKRAAARAEVKLPRGYAQKILRHSYVFAARRAKVPSEYVQLHFGHSDTRMVDRIYGRSGKEGERFELASGEIDRIRAFYDFDQFEEISRRVA